MNALRRALSGQQRSSLGERDETAPIDYAALKRGKPRVCIHDGIDLKLVHIRLAGLPVIRVPDHQTRNADLERLEHKWSGADGILEVLSTILDNGQPSSWEEKRSEVGKRTRERKAKRQAIELLDSLDVERPSKHVGTV